MRLWSISKIVGDNMDLALVRRIILCWFANSRGGAIGLVVAVFLLPTMTAAHEVRPLIANLVFTPDGGVNLEITLNLEAAIAGISTDHQDTALSPAAADYDRLRGLPPAALRDEFDNFSKVFLERLSLVADGSALPLTIAALDIPAVGDTALARISQIHLAAVPPPGIEHLVWRLDVRLGDSVVRLRDRRSDEVVVAVFVAAGEASEPLAVVGQQPEGWLQVGQRYLVIGFTHILPKGLDHILFVIGLFLLSNRLGALVWQVSAFTLAHTLTLALSMLGIFGLPAAIVEPLIAASIVYVAVENILTDKLHRWRPIVVFAFGLLHGLGFAGILQEIGPAPGQFLLSLFAFNLGVELGQLVVIAICFLAVGWTLKARWYRRLVAIPASLAIALIGAYWFAERTGFA